MAEGDSRRHQNEVGVGDEVPHREDQGDEQQEINWVQHFGDERDREGTKDETIVRMATMNINSYPGPGTVKSLRLTEETRHIECLGLSEINKNWCKIPAQMSIYNRTQHRWPHKKHQMAWLHDPAL